MRPDKGKVPTLLVDVSFKSVRVFCRSSDTNSSLAFKPLHECEEANLLHQTLAEKSKRIFQSVGTDIYDKIGMETHKMYRKGQRIVLSYFLNYLLHPFCEYLYRLR